MLIYLNDNNIDPGHLRLGQYFGATIELGHNRPVNLSARQHSRQFAVNLLMLVARLSKHDT